MDAARKLILALLVLLASCAAGPAVREIPGPAWPELPDPEGQVFYLQEAVEVPAGAVVMPLSFYQALVEYIRGMETIRAEVER